MPPGEEACTDRDTALAMSAFPEWISGVRNQGQTKLCVSGPWGALSAVNYKKNKHGNPLRPHRGWDFRLFHAEKHSNSALPKEEKSPKVSPPKPCPAALSLPPQGRKRDNAAYNAIKEAITKCGACFQHHSQQLSSFLHRQARPAVTLFPQRRTETLSLPQSIPRAYRCPAIIPLTITLPGGRSLSSLTAEQAAAKTQPAARTAASQDLPGRHG